MTVDAEAIAVQALRARLGASTSAGSRISTRLSGTFPAVRLSLVGGPPDPTQNTTRPIIQWESWGGSDTGAAEKEAGDLARLIHDVADKLVGTYAAGRVVTSRPLGHFFHSPDPQTSRERYLGQIEIWCQP